MAQPSLDDRIRGMQSELNPDTVAPPISTDNSMGQPALKRVYITGEGGGNQVDNPYAPQGASPSLSPEVRADGNGLPEPTPVDHVPDQLAQKRQQTLEALKAEGFDGYTPDVTGGKDFTPEDQHVLSQAVSDIGAGFNISLAKTLSLPRETVDRALGMLGLDYMQHGGPQQMTIDAMNRMGVPAYEVENTANKIGQGALPALATWAAMQLAAPSMAANTLVTQPGLKGAAGFLMQHVGEWALKHPVSGLWLGQSANAGGKIALGTINPTSDLGKMATEFAGELAGGAAPGAIKFWGKKLPGVGLASSLASRGLASGTNAIADALPTDLGNAIKKYNPFYKQPMVNPNKEGLINPNFDANRIQTFSKDQVYGAQVYQDKAIENAINSIPTSGTPSQVQARTHDLLQAAEKISKRIVSGFWDRVPLKKKIGVNDMRRDVINMRRELVDNDNTRPDEIIGKIIAETAPQRLPNGQFKPTQMTIAKLRDYQGQIGTAITEERAKDAPREGFIRNLARISTIIDDNIALQLPNDTSIEQARQMSTRHNDLFSRGPINDILSKRRTGDFRVPQADSIDTLLQKTDGLAALKAVQEGVSAYPRIPTTRFRPAAMRTNPYAVTPAEKAQLDDLVKSAQDSIRTSFRDAADQGPQKAVAYSQKNEDAIKALGNVAGELAFAAQKVATALAEKKAIAASALARFAETSPDKAVANIFSQRDPAGVARQLMLTFRGDPDALEGLRNEVLKHFIYVQGKTNPNILQKMIQDPRTGNLMEAVLSPDQYARLNKMISTAVRLGVEDATSWGQAFKYPVKTVGRIIGAKVGRMLNTGTIQTPGILSKATGDFLERRFGVTDPADLFSQAVLDPNWETLLYSRIPTNTREMEAAKKVYRRIFATINTAQQQTLNRLSKDKTDE